MRISWVDNSFDGVSKPKNAIIFHRDTVFVVHCGARACYLDMLLHQSSHRTVYSIRANNDISLVVRSILAVYDNARVVVVHFAYLL
jgi:hypothetical protein